MDTKEKAKSVFLPAIFILATATIVPELITGSTPLFSFLNVGLLLFLIIGYGLPVLLLRDYAIRYNLGYFGILCIGMTFGIFNEGLLAKTQILVKDLPINSFDNYGYALGVSFPWTFAISIWHAIASVLIPILILNYVFKNHTKQVFLNKKVSFILTAFLLFIASSFFLSGAEEQPQGTTTQLIVLLALMVLFFVLARFFPKRTYDNDLRGGTITYIPFYIGLSFFISYFILLSNLIAGNKIPVVIFYIVFFGLIYLYYWLAKKYNLNNDENMLLFGMGIYAQNICVAVLVNGMTGNIIQILSLIIVAVFLIWFVRRVKRNNS